MTIDYEIAKFESDLIAFINARELPPIVKHLVLKSVTDKLSNLVKSTVSEQEKMIQEEALKKEQEKEN